MPSGMDQARARIACKAIAAAGYDTIVPVVVCNPDHFGTITMETDKDVKELDTLIRLEKK